MKDQPWYVYVLVASVIFGSFYLFYIKPKSKETENIKEQRIKIENEVVRLWAKNKELNKIEGELVRMTATLKELEAIIPQQEEISDILRDIQQLAYDTRLNIIGFIPQKLIDKDFHSEKPIKVEIIGNYHNLATFFDRLRNFSRLFNIDGFSMKSIQNQSEDRTISANWTTKTFIFHDISSTKIEDKKNPGKKR